MLSLNDKLNDSKLKIEEYTRIREDSKNISNLNDYYENIKKVSNKIEEINTLKESLEDIIGNEISLDTKGKYQQSLKNFLEQIKSEKIDRLNTSYLYYISPINEHISIIKNEYNNSWKKHYEKKYMSSINLLNILYSIFQDQEIIKIKNDISKFSNKWPINSSDLKELEFNYKKAHKKINDLNLNNNIQFFLERLLNNQIRLSDVDDEIYGWLKTNKLVNKIKLKI